METKERKIVSLGGRSLTIEQVVQVARGAEGKYPKVILVDAARKRIVEMRQGIEQLIPTTVMYGINTGAGINRNRIVPINLLLGYQRDYILSHCVGDGAPLSKELTRAMMLLRVNSFAVGHSGVTIELCDKILELLNADIIPAIPKHGSLGASGDLAPLAHFGAVLIGYVDSEVWFNDVIKPTKEVFEKKGIEPIKLQPKEAMAITNGSTMTLAYACLNVYDAFDLFYIANMAAALNMEAIRAETDALDARIHKARRQIGQQVVAKHIYKMLEGSKRVTAAGREVCFFHEDKNNCKEECSQPRVQDAYSTRCVPQVHGAFWESLKFLERTVKREINASTDNPLIFKKDDGTYAVLSGGNFHGMPLALPLDNLTTAIAVLANISNCRLFRLINSQYSFGLPQDLSANDSSHSTGFMIAQYAALADVLRISSLAMPASVFSGVTSGLQEDFVSNSANAAWKNHKAIMFLQDALSKELLACCQAVDLGSEKLGDNCSQLGRITEKVHRLLRRNVSMMKKDRMLHADIEKVRELIRSRAISQLIMHLVHEPGSKKK
ncbi:MAG: aromatic amino acid ammonia-lyase [Patescibacteria group bacterium]|mgnify:FL=1